jgi:hypothetical protein
MGRGKSFGSVWCAQACCSSTQGRCSARWRGWAPPASCATRPPGCTPSLPAVRTCNEHILLACEGEPCLLSLNNLPSLLLAHVTHVALSLQRQCLGSMAGVPTSCTLLHNLS